MERLQVTLDSQWVGRKVGGWAGQDIYIYVQLNGHLILLWIYLFTGIYFYLFDDMICRQPALRLGWSESTAVRSTGGDWLPGREIYDIITFYGVWLNQHSLVHSHWSSFYKVSQKKLPCDIGLDSKPITSLLYWSNQSQSSIYVNIMVPGVTVNFLLGIPVFWIPRQS